MVTRGPRVFLTSKSGADEIPCVALHLQHPLNYHYIGLKATQIHEIKGMQKTFSLQALTSIASMKQSSIGQLEQTPGMSVEGITFN
jgi:hypothetical protein